MMVRCVILAAASCLVMAASEASAGSSATARPRIALPLFGLSVVLPDGWEADIPAPKPIPLKENAHTFQTEVDAVCETAACASSREVCAVKVYDEVMDTRDFISNRLLFPTQASRDETTKVVLDWTRKGATVARPLGPEIIGRTTWYTIETDPAPGYKAVLPGESHLSFLG